MGNEAMRRILMNVYQRLSDQYGPQHWWPAREPFEVIAGAILTQSAAWVNVEKAITNLRAAKAMSPAALRELPQTEVARLVYPSGYYNAKAKKLKAFARWFGEKYHDSLDEMFDTETDTLREELLAVYGIGEETADSIILYAGNKPIFVIDAYTRRLIDRAGLPLTKNNYAGYQSFFMDNLPADAKLYNEYHALLVRQAKYVCKKQPLCDQCCLNYRGTVNGNKFPCSAIFNNQ
jgi:endonuclease III related protein